MDNINIQCAETESVDEFIDRATIDEIKKTDPHPFLRAYIVAHEGVSKSRQIGHGSPVSRVIRWGRDAIRGIYDGLKVGLQFFLGHNHDSSTEGRKEYGRVIGRGIKEINGKLSAIAVAYFPPETRRLIDRATAISAEMTASIEDAGKEFVAKEIGKITGLAISQTDRPAFPDAYAIAELQCFEETKMDLSTVTFEDLIAEVKKRNTLPTQVWNTNELQHDRNVKGIISELRKEAEENNRAAFESLKTESEKKIGDLQTQLSDYQSRAIRYEAVPLIEKKMADEKFPAQAIAFAKQNLDKLFRVEKDLQSSVDSYVADMKLIHERAVQSGYSLGANEQAKTPGGSGSEVDYTKPEHNEFIPKKQ